MRCSFNEAGVWQSPVPAWPGPGREDLNYRRFTLSCFTDPSRGTFLSSPEHPLLWGSPDLWVGEL